MQNSVLEIHPVTIEGGEVVYRGIFCAPCRNDASVTFRVPVNESEPINESGMVEAFTLVFLLPAMRVGLPFVVNGAIDANFRRNLEQLKGFWTNLVPEKFSMIETKFTDCEEPTPEVPKAAVSCFSGGVDSCYTAIQISGSDDGAIIPCPLEGMVMVHGLDIPFRQSEVFESAFQRSEKIASSLNLPLHRISTDVRNIQKQFDLDWLTEYHIFPVASALYLFSHRYQLAVIPPGYSYDKLSLPNGSNPISDLFLGSGRMGFFHHGASAIRFDKVKAICGHQAVSDNARVCFEGSRLDRNCGKCLKCCSLQIALQLNGIREPKCFSEPIDFQYLENLALENHSVRGTFQEYAKISRERGEMQLLSSLEICLEKNRHVEEYAQQQKRKNRFNNKLKRFLSKIR